MTAPAVLINPVVAAITLWKHALSWNAPSLCLGKSQAVDTALLQQVSPLGWEHVGLTATTSGTLVSEWPKAASARSGLPEPGSAILSVRKFPFLEVPHSSEHLTLLPY